MNLISFETPPLGRSTQDGSSSSSGITAATTTIKAKEAASHLDLSLGISLSHGGGSGGDAGTKASSCCYGGRGGDGAGCMGSGMLTAGVLGVGHGGSIHENTASSGVGGCGSWTAAFMPSPTGFMHPWSLAARQQKAAAEQERSCVARLPPATYMPRAAPTVISLPLAAVGWPPVHTSRRNLVATVNNVLKPDDATAVKPDRPTQAKTMDETTATAARNTAAAAEASRPLNMFAKVHMDGYKVGRKINLRAHSNYNSLRRVLTKMTHYSSTNKGEEDCAKSDEFIFLYEDFEGDRMLVGDVPWELFLASAKRLYIAKNPAPRNKENAEIAKRKETEDAIDN
uniref:Auxin-responsive protein n=1 Tax=Oryza punctata TaxID=4537 RepID=A0A0E0MDY7_ORYPU